MMIATVDKFAMARRTEAGNLFHEGVSDTAPHGQVMNANLDIIKREIYHL